MWFENQNCAMMGLQATAGKRKLEAAVVGAGVAKAARWADCPPLATPTATPPTADDCIARLRAVAVPGEAAWQSNGPQTTPITSPLTSALLSDDDDDLDDYDDFSDDDRTPPNAQSTPITYPPTPPQGYQPSSRYPDYNAYRQSGGVNGQSNQGGNYYDESYQYQNRGRGSYWSGSYYSQQTIRCEENGKSYLELGSAPPILRNGGVAVNSSPNNGPMGGAVNSVGTLGGTRCCDGGRTRWCNHPCYRQRRLAVLNLSMCKLARYRQCSDPSLRRSVLICNTLRLLEREMEAEQIQQTPEVFNTTPFSEYGPQSTLNSSLTPSITPGMNSSGIQSSLTPGLTPTMSTAEPIYEQNLREISSTSGRATPFPTAPQSDNETDSGIGDEDSSRTINWSSVLSLTSQMDLDPLNNNELYNDNTEVQSNNVNGSASSSSTNEVESSTEQLMDEFLPMWNRSTCSGDENLRTEQFGSSGYQGGEWDSFMQVLVGGS